MRPLVVLFALTAATGLAHAGAVLSGPGGTSRFPTSIDVAVDIHAQVESTTMLLHFPAVSAGDHVLTVPGPRRAYVVGVDVDQGAGLQPAAMVGEAPPPSLGGSPTAQLPAVATWLGNDPLRADLADLGDGPLTVRVRFQRLLRRHRGEVAFSAGIARSPARPANDPGPTVTLRLTLTPLRALQRFDTTSTSGAPAQVTRNPDGSALVEASGAGGASVDIRYAEVAAGLDVHFLTHRTPDADPLGGQAGYFMLIVDADAADAAAAPPRTLSLVIDHSGSMSGDKIVQATAAARAMLEHLRPVDSFNIVAFDHTVSAFRRAPVLTTPAELDAARTFIKAIVAAGSTDIDLGVMTGLAGVSAHEATRYDAMILLSDGHATAGETSSARIHANLLRYNAAAQARVFTFAVGADADLALMEGLARSNRGTAFRLNDAQARLELVERTDELFADLESPLLTDVTPTLTGFATADVLPEQMADVFSGGQAILVGRYSSPGRGSLRLTGSLSGAPFVRDFSLDAPADQPADAFIKYLWATERVGAHLADSARTGDTTGAKTKITELGLAYRIQTPYTSFSTRQSFDGSGTGGGGGSSGGGGGGGGGGWGAGANGPFELLALLALLGLAAILHRRSTRPAAGSRPR